MLRKHCPDCPYCSLRPTSGGRPPVVRKGSYFREDDQMIIEKYLCRECGAYFSEAVFDKCYRQKKRSHNKSIFKALVSLESQRRIALTEPLNRKTVAHRLVFFGRLCRDRFKAYNESKAPAQNLEFDDLETCLHTKLKPVAVSLAVESKTRRILGFEVSQMPAKGTFAAKSLKKYGPLPDMRIKARDDLFQSLKPFTKPDLTIKTDKHPGYPRSIKKNFPEATHIRLRSRRARVNGQGEIKSGGWDPLFSLNHTCAMFRANINRLIRKTWCTSKRLDRLRDHIFMYACFHNEFLL